MNSSAKLLEEERDVSSSGVVVFGNYADQYVPMRQVEHKADASTAGIVFADTHAGYQFATAPVLVMSGVVEWLVIRKARVEPVIGNVEVEYNPIIRVLPKTGKRYAMKVVGKKEGSFKPTSLGNIE